MKNTSALFGMVLATALTLPVAGATAKVVYSLNETILGPAPGFEGTLTEPLFISTDTTFPVADFSVSNNPLSIVNVEVAPDSSNPLCSAFGLNKCDLIVLNASGGFDEYGYPVGTFSGLGENTAVNGGFSMVLTVSQNGVIPEPSTWALMALGFAGLGLVGWRSRRRSVAIAA